MNDFKHNKKALSQFISAEMGKRGIISHKEFAEFIGVSQATISRIFDETHSYEPSLSFIAQLAGKTGVYLPDLLRAIYPELVQETTPSALSRVVAQQLDSLPENMRDAVIAFIMGTGTFNKGTSKSD